MYNVLDLAKEYDANQNTSPDVISLQYLIFFRKMFLKIKADNKVTMLNKC